MKESSIFTRVREGVFARCNGLVLSFIEESEYDIYMEVLYENSFMKGYFDDEEFTNNLWSRMVCDSSLFLSVYSDDEFCGYVGVKKIDTTTPEIAIELLKKCHGRGVGYNALLIFMAEYAKIVKVDYYLSRVDAENVTSIGLMKKLGGKPFGLNNLLYISSEDKARVEEKYVHLISDNMRKLAHEWNVEPEKLLSHALQFKIDC